MIEDYYDPEFERLLREEEAIENEAAREDHLWELEAKIARDNRIFASIKAYCTLMENGHLSSWETMKSIQKIVG